MATSGESPRVHAGENVNNYICEADNFHVNVRKKNPSKTQELNL